MKTSFIVVVFAFFLVQLALAQVDPRWKPNDEKRPVPPVIEPGTASTQDSPGRPPSDALCYSTAKIFRNGMAKMAKPRNGR
jgi:hypothetical protein